MKIIQSKNYKEAQILDGFGTGEQTNESKIKDLIRQGMDVGQAIRVVYPDLMPVQVEELKKYYAERI